MHSPTADTKSSAIKRLQNTVTGRRTGSGATDIISRSSTSSIVEDDPVARKSSMMSSYSYYSSISKRPAPEVQKQERYPIASAPPSPPLPPSAPALSSDDGARSSFAVLTPTPDAAVEQHSVKSGTRRMTRFKESLRERVSSVSSTWAKSRASTSSTMHGQADGSPCDVVAPAAQTPSRRLRKKSLPVSAGTAATTQNHLQEEEAGGNRVPCSGRNSERRSAIYVTKDGISAGKAGFFYFVDEDNTTADCEDTTMDGWDDVFGIPVQEEGVKEK